MDTIRMFGCFRIEKGEKWKLPADIREHESSHTFKETDTLDRLLN